MREEVQAEASLLPSSLPPPLPRRARRSRPLEWLAVGVAALVLLILGSMLALLAVERSYGPRIHPNISIRGTSVGGLTVQQARESLQRRYADFLQQPVEITWNGQRWQPPLEQLGVTLALDEAVQAAASLGWNDTRLENARTVAATLEQGAELPLRIEVDERRLQNYLLLLARNVETPATNAALALDGTAITVTPEAMGTQLLVDETARDIIAALQSLAPQQVVLRTRQLVPLVRDSDVAPVAAELHTLLEGPLVLSFDEQRWEWPPEQIARWVSLHTTVQDGRINYRVTFDTNGPRSALLPVATALRQEGLPPRVDWNGGDMRITWPGTEGLGLDAEAALALVEGALRGGPRTIELTRKPIPPPVTAANLQLLGITGLIGEGVSSFRGSENYRITNIVAGARRMHGVLLPPGAAFSFNDTLGVVDESGGFVPGYAIVDNRTQKEWGGGLCQVSTTVFRAAFWAGLPITERHEHAFRISWYEELGEPPGLDAAIYTGYSDVRFVNDTGGWLLMQSWVDQAQQRLHIALYGPPTGRSVTMAHQVLETSPAPSKATYIDDPTLPAGTLKKTDTARGGMKVEVYRVVRQGESVLYYDTFETEFKPWPNIYLRGTG